MGLNIIRRRLIIITGASVAETLARSNERAPERASEAERQKQGGE